MPSTEYNEHYVVKTKTFASLLQLDEKIMSGLKRTKLESYLRKRDLDPYLWKNMITGELDGETVYGYSMPEMWKHKYIDNLVSELDVDLIEKMIGELGIRKAFKLYEDMGVGDPNPAKDKGLQQLFYGVLYQIIQVHDVIEPIEKEEYDKYAWEIGNNDESDDEE